MTSEPLIIGDAAPARPLRRRAVREVLRGWRNTVFTVANRVKESIEDFGGSVSDSLQISGNRVQLPQWLFLYLIAQLVGGVWWAATLQSDVRYLQQENAKLWQKVETHDLQLARMDAVVRAAVKEAMQDADYIRLNRKGE